MHLSQSMISLIQSFQVYAGLEFGPTSIEWLDDSRFLVSYQPGRIHIVNFTSRGTNSSAVRYIFSFKGD
jgi:hypothetical protein